MQEISPNNKRIAKNTLLLYFRMLFTMAVSLYTSRVVLNILGVEDFGIYNVVGGIVAMFGFINGSMASATIPDIRIRPRQQKSISKSFLHQSFNTCHYIFFHCIISRNDRTLVFME